ncbi:Phox homologous domain [Phytophthora cactorum]|nr:Phox homologous domain [Phytophthora cactorum]
MSAGSTSTMMPNLQSLSPASAPLSFLEKIDHVEINRTTMRGGVVYYVLDVYLEHSTSRIPTNKTTTTGRPDYQLQRRFNDFANLRYQYCDAFMSYVVHSMSQPRLFVKLATGVDTRKKLMGKFCNEFLSMTVGGKTSQDLATSRVTGFKPSRT